MLVDQWQEFGSRSELMYRAGIHQDFYPYSSPIPRLQLRSQRIETQGKLKQLLEGNDLQYIACREQKKHRDSELFPQWSAFLILRNDGFIAKGSRQSRFDIAPQLPGCILVLDIHKEHHVIRDTRIDLYQPGYWLAAMVEFEQEDPPDRKLVVEIFTEFLRSLIT